MDWVEQRAERERIIRESAPELWRDLCSAINEAVKSMQRYYQEKALVNVEFVRVHENQVVVRRRQMSDRFEKFTSDCSFTFNPESCEIVVAIDNRRNA